MRLSRRDALRTTLGALGALGLPACAPDRADGRVETLTHIGSAEMAPGDVFEIHTPGAEPWNRPKPPRSRTGSVPGS
mgnify:CR=1 FL=1